MRNDDDQLCTKQKTLERKETIHAQSDNSDETLGVGNGKMAFPESGSGIS